MSILKRLELLRNEMIKNHIDAYIIPSADPHQSEYPADHWQVRKWISGFTGSAGTVVVLLDKAGLWTDSRYFLQAEAELKGSSIVLFKMKNQFEPEYVDYIIENLPKNKVVGIDGSLWSQYSYRVMAGKLEAAGLGFVSDKDLFTPIWSHRPELSKEKIFIHDIKFCGQSVKEKLSAIRARMSALKVEYHLISALDDIAWTYNIRGRDVAYNPVAISYGLVGLDFAYLFVDIEKLNVYDLNYFSDNEIKVLDYSQINTYIESLSKNTSILVDPTICSSTSYRTIKAQIVEGASIPKILKAIKNPVEIKHIRHAMAKDGAALAHTFYWLENVLKKEPVTEYEVLQKLAHYRSEQAYYFGESFGAIVGYKGNGAIIHYAPPASGSATIHNEGILLVDSGGQYFDGTTDITRTFSLDAPNEEQKKHYTLILKGLISLSKIIFPKGTYGGQLDTLARQYLWENGLNYLHGTGHGVGFFLNVHEPPQGFATIQSERGRTVMEAGMLTSNEPGHYIPNQYGMRLENLVVCQESDTEGFLSLETVTVYPFDLSLIEQRLLTPADIKWINEYHELVWQRVSPLLTGDLRDWFAVKCQKLVWND